MKKWNSPELEVLDILETAHRGHHGDREHSSHHPIVTPPVNYPGHSSGNTEDNNTGDGDTDYIS